MHKSMIVFVAVVMAVACAIIGLSSVGAQNFGRLPVSWLTVNRQADISGIASVIPDNQTANLVSEFTLRSNSSYIWVTSNTGSITSSTTEAISDGWQLGQIIGVKNVGTNSVVIKNSANTDLGAADVTLGATDQLWAIWNGTVWDKLFVADN